MTYYRLHSYMICFGALSCLTVLYRMLYGITYPIIYHARLLYIIWYYQVHIVSSCLG